MEACERAMYKGEFVSYFEKSDFESKILYITEKVENRFFWYLIIFNNLFKYVKNDFFSEKSNFLGKKILSKRTLNMVLVDELKVHDICKLQACERNIYLFDLLYY